MRRFWLVFSQAVTVAVAVLFVVSTLVRSMMAAYVGAITFVMCYLITSYVVGQKH